MPSFDASDSLGILTNDMSHYAHQLVSLCSASQKVREVVAPTMPMCIGTRNLCEEGRP